MTFSYDPSTPLGRVRMLADERDESTCYFKDDDELEQLINLYGGDARLSAAAALDIKAANEAYIQMRVTVEGLSLDGPAVARELRALAQQYRDEVAAGLAETDPDVDEGFAVAEMNLDPFTRRQLVWNRRLRGG